MNINQETSKNLILQMVFSNNMMKNKQNLHLNYSTMIMVKFLGQALNRSVSNYQKRLIESVQNDINMQKSKENQAKRVNDQKVSVSYCHQIIQITSDKQQQQQIKQIKQKQINPSKHIAVVTSISNQQLPKKVATVEQRQEKTTVTPIKPQAQVKINTNQPQIITKPHHPHKHEAVLPVVDLIDSAYLPVFVARSQSMAAKRDRLMKREVKVWKSFIKGNKYKRLRSEANL